MSRTENRESDVDLDADWHEDRNSRFVHRRGHPIVNKGDGWHAYLKTTHEPRLRAAGRVFIYLGAATSTSKAKAVVEDALRRIDDGELTYAPFSRGLVFQPR